MLLLRWIEKQRYVPAEKKTPPPPAAAAASIARLIAGESSALPSPLAPNFLTSKSPAFAAIALSTPAVTIPKVVWLWVRVPEHRNANTRRKPTIVDSNPVFFIVISD